MKKQTPTTLLRLATSMMSLALSVGVASATTYVMATDDELLDRASLVVHGRFLGAEVLSDGGRPATDYLFEVDRAVKGFFPGGTLLTRLPGGSLPGEDMGLRVFGLPSFSAGQEAVLFLRAGRDGTFDLVELGLGAFEVVRQGGQQYARRDLRGATIVSMPGDARSEERIRAQQPRRLRPFLDWLANRAEGRGGEADYFADGAAADLVAQTAPFVPTRSGAACGGTAGSALRWRQFDSGTQVRYLMNESGQPGVPGGGASEIRNAMAAWAAVPGADIFLRLGGTTTATVAGASADGIDAMVFEDPSNEIPGSFGGSGTLAVATVFFRCNVHGFDGGNAHSIEEIGIVSQDGFGANYLGSSSDPALAFAEVFGHEIGHTLGLAHPCGEAGKPACTGTVGDALMVPFAHNDGRGAQLGSDDRQGARFLYPSSSTMLAPDPPSDLTATPASTTEILVDWTDNSDNETGFEISERSNGADFALLAVVAANQTSLTVEGLSEASYREYRVRAVNDVGPSASSNTDGATTLASVRACVEDDETLCLSGDRFEVRADFLTNDGQSGQAKAIELTGDTGYFWFFNDTNVEMVIKALAACPINQHFWIFAGGLTNVQVETTVIDRASGEAKTYFNPLETPFQPIQDTAAFATCP